MLGTTLRWESLCVSVCVREGENRRGREIEKRDRGKDR